LGERDTIPQQCGRVALAIAYGEDFPLGLAVALVVLFMGVTFVPARNFPFARDGSAAFAGRYGPCPDRFGAARSASGWSTCR
jgi:hypothetical protein